MLDLVVVTIVMMCNATVMIAVLLVRDLRQWADVQIRQRLHRMSKPRIMRDSTAEKH